MAGLKQYGIFDMGDMEEMKRCEAQAEAACSAMYDAAPHNVKDYYEDACLYFSQAVQIAKTLNLESEAERLKKRSEHVDAVCNSQFRYAGR